MKTTTTAGWLVLALGLAATGVQAQRVERPGPGPDRAERPGRLVRAVQVTLDRAEILGLEADQVAGLEQLRADVLAATSALQEEMQVRRDARRATLRQELQEREPLPAEAEARAQVLRERREEMRERRLARRAEARELRERVATTLDPLVQRYEQLIPPSQRPLLRTDTTGRRGNAPRGLRGRDDRGRDAFRRGDGPRCGDRGDRWGLQRGPRRGGPPGTGSVR